MTPRVSSAAPQVRAPSEDRRRGCCPSPSCLCGPAFCPQGKRSPASPRARQPHGPNLPGSPSLSFVPFSHTPASAWWAVGCVPGSACPMHVPVPCVCPSRVVHSPRHPWGGQRVTSRKSTCVLRRLRAQPMTPCCPRTGRGCIWNGHPQPMWTAQRTRHVDLGRPGEENSGSQAGTVHLNQGWGHRQSFSGAAAAQPMGSY